MLAPELFSSRRGEASEPGCRIVEGVAVLNVNGSLAASRPTRNGREHLPAGLHDLTADLEDAITLSARISTPARRRSGSDHTTALGQKHLADASTHRRYCIRI
ncbi:hypothetical protein [Variovorax paradoxus]|uniref:hypothetical protein n=1 Tax=Variovorax paradoxus TaxID=34073 RepID=UPI003D6555E5